MRPSTLVRAPLFYAVLLALGATSLAWNLCALLLYPLLPRPLGRAIGRAVISYSYRLVWAAGQVTGTLALDAAGLAALRDEPGGLIIVANHPTMLDALLLIAQMPRSACIMKADLMRNVFLGAGARLARYIRNDSAQGLIRLAVEDLRRGGQLVIFPEGTRTTELPVNGFRCGCTHIAKAAGVPIQTVVIETDTPYLRKGWPIWRVPPLPIRMRLRLGRRFDPVPRANPQLAELERYFRAEVHAPAGEGQG